MAPSFLKILADLDNPPPPALRDMGVSLLRVPRFLVASKGHQEQNRSHLRGSPKKQTSRLAGCIPSPCPPRHASLDRRDDAHRRGRGFRRPHVVQEVQCAAPGRGMHAALQEQVEPDPGNRKVYLLFAALKGRSTSKPQIVGVCPKK